MTEKRPDTNVTIPKPALDRLSEIDWALGNKSRDQDRPLPALEVHQA